MSRVDELITIIGTIKFESTKAVLFKPDPDIVEVDYATIEEANKGVWIPYSQIRKLVKSPNSNCDELIITKWIANQKGIQS